MRLGVDSWLMNGDALECLQDLPAESVDALVTDPPAGIAFMGKEWDKDKGGRDAWVEWMTGVMRECYRVLKPGAHGFVWALPRTSHWTATALENAGFEVRDCVSHIFGSGFPKSASVEKHLEKMNHPDAKNWTGFGTALKPAHEVWWLVRKPLSEKTVAKNVLKHGTGALNIDASRVEYQSDSDFENAKGGDSAQKNLTETHKWGNLKPQSEKISGQGRFPANLIVSGTARDALDKQSGFLQPGSHPKKRSGMGYHGGNGTEMESRINTDSGGASRFFFDGADPFFYAPKASKRERNAGMPEGKTNGHPTIKSQRLMRYLCKMICPPGGVVLDPFMGSGSTGVACESEGFKFIGIDAEKEYVEIARARISAVQSQEALEGIG